MPKKYVCLVTVLMSVFHIVSAQTTYKNVTLDRGKDTETNCIYVFNDNADSVKVIIKYKVGNRYTNWIDYPIEDTIPPSICDPYLVGCIDSTIIGLNLVDVITIHNRTEYNTSIKANNTFKHWIERLRHNFLKRP